MTWLSNFIHFKMNIRAITCSQILWQRLFIKAKDSRFLHNLGKRMWPSIGYSYSILLQRGRTWIIFPHNICILQNTNDLENKPHLHLLGFKVGHHKTYPLCLRDGWIKVILIEPTMMVAVKKSKSKETNWKKKTITGNCQKEIQVLRSMRIVAEHEENEEQDLSFFMLALNHVNLY